MNASVAIQTLPGVTGDNDTTPNHRFFIWWAMPYKKERANVL